MILTVTISTLMALSILWYILDIKYGWETDFGTIISLSIIGCFFVANIVCLFIIPAATRSDIKQFESVRLTIEQQRSNKLSEYERVQLTIKIVEKNSWLAGEQFWAQNKWLNWYYDKSILDVKPIE